jgi:hypothetical protein
MFIFFDILGKKLDYEKLLDSLKKEMLEILKILSKARKNTRITE